MSGLDEVGGVVTRIGFDHQLPGWAWLLVLLVIAAACASVYVRQQAPLKWRAVLAAVRGMVALLLVVLLLGPRHEAVTQDQVRDVVVVLVDRSASLTIADVAGPGESRATRDAQARSVMGAAGAGQGVPWWQSIQASRELMALRFDGSVAPLDLDATLPDPDGRRTDISAALTEAMRRTAGRPVAGIVLISDGRTESPVSRRVIRELEQRGIAVFAVPLGSATMASDLEVLDVDAPRRAYVRDTVPVRVEVRSNGETPRTPVIVRLLEADGTTLVDETTVEPSAWVDGRAETMMVAQSGDPGDRRFRVMVDAGEGDLVVENNSRDVDVSFADEPLRVLYLEGYPRWEYRYLKNLLVREETIESSVMLVSADLDFAQEGNMPLARMPQTDEEFSQFDLFIIGDVPGTFLSPTQVEALRRSVGERGAGLLWMGGERATPTSWRGTAIEDLLPFRNAEVRGEAGSWSIQPTRAAERLGVLRLDERGGWPQALAHPAQRWARVAWRQAMPLANLKSAVEVLAQAIPLDGHEPMAIVTLMRFGAGEVIYVGTDETWRWRHGIGETLQERFWVQLVRQLARTSLAARGSAATVELEPVPALLDRPCTIRVQLRDSRRDPAELEPLSVTTMDPAGERRVVPLTRQGSSGLFSGSFEPTTAGSWSIVLDDPRLGDRVETMVPVERVDDELANPAADHASLASLAKGTGGAMVNPEVIDTLPSLLPDRSVRSERVVATPLWHVWWVLVALLSLLGVEWVTRKAMRLA